MSGGKRNNAEQNAFVAGALDANKGVVFKSSAAQHKPHIEDYVAGWDYARGTEKAIYPDAGVVGYSNGMETELEIAWSNFKYEVCIAARQDTIDLLSGAPKWMWDLFPRRLRLWCFMKDGSKR